MRDVRDDDEGSGDIDDDDELAVLVADPPVEGETGKTADEQRRRVDQVSPEVEGFGQVDGLEVQDVHDVLDMAPGAEVDQEGA